MSELALINEEHIDKIVESWFDFSSERHSPNPTVVMSVRRCTVLNAIDLPF